MCHECSARSDEPALPADQARTRGFLFGDIGIQHVGLAGEQRVDRREAVDIVPVKQHGRALAFDIAEIGAGDHGEDVCNEVKCFAALKKNGGAGRGGINGGTVAAVGHKYPFGNTEEQCRMIAGE